MNSKKEYMCIENQNLYIYLNKFKDIFIIINNMFNYFLFIALIGFLYAYEPSCSTCKFKFCRCLYILKLQFTRGVVAKWSLALLVRENRWRPKDHRFASRPRRSSNKFTASTFLECQNHLFPLSQSFQYLWSNNYPLCGSHF